MPRSTYFNIRRFSLFIFALIPLAASAQLSLEGEFRPRTEFRNGYRILSSAADNPAFFTSQRTRLNFKYEKDFYDFYISAQDVRTWGEVVQLQDEPNVNIHEAWAEIHLSGFFDLKPGRQELVYDDQRLLGSVNWAQQGRSHDALVLKYNDAASAWKVHLGGAYNQEGQNLSGNRYTLNNYKLLSYLWAEKKLGVLNISGLVITDGFELPSGGVNYRYTYGGQVNAGDKNWNAAASVYLQNGDDATRRGISAYMVAVKGSYKLDSFTLTGGVDYLSGGSAGDADPMQGAFNTLYATNHKFYGHMDYFLDIPSDTRGGGLQDVFAGGSYKASQEARIDLVYHYFSLANDVFDPFNAGKKLSGTLASEIDISCTYAFKEDIVFRLGYSLLFEDSSLERLQGRTSSGLQQWGWAMLILSPEIL